MEAEDVQIQTAHGTVGGGEGGGGEGGGVGDANQPSVLYVSDDKTSSEIFTVG